MVQALPLPPPIVFNGIIADTPSGLIAVMPTQQNAGGNVLSLHSTTPTGLSPQVAQFNPGKSFSYQAFCEIISLFVRKHGC